MKILLIYISPGKTTEKISLELAKRFQSSGHTVSHLNIGKKGFRTIDEVGEALFKDIDVVGIGSPVFHLRVMHPLTDFLHRALPALNPSARAFMYLTYGGISSGKALHDLSSLFRRHRIPISGAFKVWAPHFYNPIDYPDKEALATIDEFCGRLESSGFGILDNEKVDNLFSKQTLKVNIAYSLAGIVGKFRELPIAFDADKCVGCKRCVNECPVGALTMNGIPVRDTSKCVYCYHCTLACKKNAVICPTEKVKDMVRTNKKILGCEDPQNAVYM